MTWRMRSGFWRKIRKRLTIQDITGMIGGKTFHRWAGMMSNPGVAAKMFESLYNSGSAST